MKINIPEVLVHLRGEVVRHKQDTTRGLDPEGMAMKWLAGVFASPAKFERAQRIGRMGQRFFMKGDVIESLPGPFGGWTAMRDVFPVAKQTFREWWRTRS